MKSGMKDYPTKLSSPVNSTAARVVGKGFQYVQAKKPNLANKVWTEPPPLMPCPDTIKQWIGTRHDRMRIVGYLMRDPKSGHKWLARCDCGKYEVRGHDNWRKPREKYIDQCDPCKSFLQKKRSYEREKYFELTGKWPDDAPL